MTFSSHFSKIIFSQTSQQYSLAVPHQKHEGNKHYFVKKQYSVENWFLSRTLYLLVCVPKPLMSSSL